MGKLNIKIRMCIACRGRFFQKELFRFQCIKNELVRYTGKGRSFYICKGCIVNDKKIAKSLLRYCKRDIEEILNNVKKMVIDHKEKIVNG